MKELGRPLQNKQAKQLSWGERESNMHLERDGCIDRGLKPAKVQAKQNQLTPKE